MSIAFWTIPAVANSQITNWTLQFFFAKWCAIIIKHLIWSIKFSTLIANFAWADSHITCVMHTSNHTWFGAQDLAQVLTQVIRPLLLGPCWTCSSVQNLPMVKNLKYPYRKAQKYNPFIQFLHDHVWNISSFGQEGKLLWWDTFP